jgi:hypothetical protein
MDRADHSRVQIYVQGKGGIYGGIFGNYDWSGGWGPTVNVTAAGNIRSLKQFLQFSGITLPSKLGSLVPAGETLRKFMQL